MDNAISKRKGRRVRLNTERLFSLGIVKGTAAAAFGFIAALPIKAIGVSPFAAAAVAIMPRSWVYLCYLGGFFSYMTNSFYESAAPLSAMTAILLFRLLFKGKGKTLSDAYVAPIAVFLSLTVTGILCGDLKLTDLPGSFGWLAISAVAAGAAYVLKSAVDIYGKTIFGLEPVNLAKIAAAAFLLLLPLESVKPFGISVLGVTAATCALIFAVKLNGTESFFSSVYFGAAWAIGALRPEFLFILPVCVLYSRMLFSLGKLPCAAGFVALRFGFNLVFTPITELMPQMIEVLIAAFVLVALPHRALSRTSLTAKSGSRQTAEEQVADKLKETATLFRYFSESIADVSAEVSRELTPTPEGCVSHIRGNLCANCELTRFCSGVKRQEVSEGIYKYASDAVYGKASAASLPRCAHLSEMENEIRDYMLRDDAHNAEVDEIRELSTESYSIVSDALDDLSAEFSSEIGVPEMCADADERVEVSGETFKNECEANSGDSYEYFTHGKYLYVIISDGMGSGKFASIESKMTCGLIKRFMISGFSFATALKLANAALKLKGGDESFATADICRLDTETGSFSIAKAGAAASYMISENRIRRLYSPTLPVGILKEARFEVISSKLRKGDLLIMLSDGALNNGDEWLNSSHFYGCDASSVCSGIIKKGRESYGSSPADDITAVCVKLKE